MNETREFSVRIASMSMLIPETGSEQATVETQSGLVTGFKARKMIPEKKNIKLMTRAVQLGVACIADAVSKVPHWESIPAERRGIYVGASPQMGEPTDLKYAIEAAYSTGTFSLADFARKGIEQIHPLWLVRGLSNNVLGFSSAHHDIQGWNMNYAMGEEGGWNAIVEAIQALHEGRVDIVVAGASDNMTRAKPVLGETCSEGAAFLIFERGEQMLRLDRAALQHRVAHFGHLGAAKWPVAIVLQELAKE